MPSNIASQCRTFVSTEQFLNKKNLSTGFVQLPRTFRKKLKDDNDNTNQVKRHNHVQSWPQLS